MSWVYYADRKPTASDGNASGRVLWCSGDHFCMVPWQNEYEEYCAWMPTKDLPPLPPRKIWRTPTQADLDKANEPIPCRVSDTEQPWINDRLFGIAKFGSSKFVGSNATWRYCEIEVDG